MTRSSPPSQTAQAASDGAKANPSRPPFQLPVLQSPIRKSRPPPPPQTPPPPRLPLRKGGGWGIVSHLLFTVWVFLAKFIYWWFVETLWPSDHPYPTAAAQDATPAWLRARQRNDKDCPLYQLPDALLVQIRDHADTVSRHALRQSCALFMRIVSDMDRKRGPDGRLPRLCSHWRRVLEQKFGATIPQPFHGAQCGRKGDREEGEEPRSDREARDEIFEFFPAHPKCYLDDYCSDCRAFHESGKFAAAMKALGKDMWCESCQMQHRRLFFSAADRAKPDDQRICIGWQGQVRLCPHERLSWEEYQQGSSSADRTCRSCPDTFCFPPKIAVSSSRILVSWTTAVFDLDPYIPITRQHLRNFLTSPQPSPMDDVLCPHVRRHDLQLMLAFAPDRCVCFPDALQQKQAITMYPVWSCRGKDNVHRRSRFMPGDSNLLEEYLEEYPSRHFYQCRACSAKYSWIRDKRGRVYLRMTRNSKSTDTFLRRRWLSTLDLDSWGCRDDEELHRIMWCENENCRTERRWPALLQDSPGIQE